MVSRVNHATRVLLDCLGVHQAILWIVCRRVLSAGLGPASLGAPIYVSLHRLPNILVLSYHSLLLLIAARIRHVSPLLCIVDDSGGLVGCRIDPKLTQVQRHLLLYCVEVVLHTWPLFSLYSPRSPLGS